MDRTRRFADKLGRQNSAMTKAHRDTLTGATGAWSHNLGKGAVRAFCCRSPNPWGLPAGDRSGRLELIEEPHLGHLIAKTNQQKE